MYPKKEVSFRFMRDHRKRHRISKRLVHSNNVRVVHRRIYESKKKPIVLYAGKSYEIVSMDW